MAPTSGTIELLWIPLGSGARVVRASGWLFEAVCALAAARPRQRLFHSALVITLDGTRTTVEVGPVLRGDPSARGVVASGPVGVRWLRRWRIFRYEVRCWPGGTIPDADAAEGGPHLLSRDRAVACWLIELTALVPAPTWGRDELRCGEMWNSNSVTSWLLTSAGIDVSQVAPPTGGRAPGWSAGLVEGSRPSPRRGRPVTWHPDPTPGSEEP